MAFWKENNGSGTKLYNIKMKENMAKTKYTDIKIKLVSWMVEH
jgi:hypothetical protein